MIFRISELSAYRQTRNPKARSIVISFCAKMARCPPRTDCLWCTLVEGLQPFRATAQVPPSRICLNNFVIMADVPTSAARALVNVKDVGMLLLSYVRRRFQLIELFLGHFLVRKGEFTTPCAVRSAIAPQWPPLRQLLLCIPFPHSGLLLIGNYPSFVALQSVQRGGQWRPPHVAPHPAIAHTDLQPQPLAQSGARSYILASGFIQGGLSSGKEFARRAQDCRRDGNNVVLP